MGKSVKVDPNLFVVMTERAMCCGDVEALLTSGRRHRNFHMEIVPVMCRFIGGLLRLGSAWPGKSEISLWKSRNARALRAEDTEEPEALKCRHVRVSNSDTQPQTSSWR